MNGRKETADEYVMLFYMDFRFHPSKRDSATIESTMKGLRDHYDSGVLQRRLSLGRLSITPITKARREITVTFDKAGFLKRR